MNPAVLRIGTRGSKLALWQADWVAKRLEVAGFKSELVTIATRGDREPAGPIAALGGEGVFTKELQKAVLDGRIDLAVHSLKDLPTEEAKGLALAAVPLRDSPHDALVSTQPRGFLDLPQEARIGTGSLRRRCQLLHLRADLQILDIRGNVETRLAKLDDRQYDAIILAEAGLARLGLAGRATEILSPSVMLPAVGQGALAVETRAGDRSTREIVARIDDEEAHQSVLAERSLLLTLRGGCLAPIAAWGRIEDDGRLHLSACVLSADGSRRLATDLLGNAADAVTIGRHAAEQLLDQGAEKLIADARSIVNRER
jgi:hydroxymethylbilane synthase